MHLVRLLVALAAACPIAPLAAATARQAPPAPETLFASLDTNGDNLLSRDEFVQGMEKLAQNGPGGANGGQGGGQGGGARRGNGPPPPGSPGRRGDGPPPPPPGGPGQSARSGSGQPTGSSGTSTTITAPDPGTIEDHLSAAFTAADADNSGTLTLDEFKQALASLPPPPPPR